MTASASHGPDHRGANNASATPLDWANTRRTFDGARLLYKGEGWTSDLFYTYAVPVVPNQIDEPDYAPLMDDMFFAQGGDIPINRFIAPRVEVELAFILGKPLVGPNVTLFDVLSATEYVMPSRWAPSRRVVSKTWNASPSGELRSVRVVGPMESAPGEDEPGEDTVIPIS